MVRRQYVLAIEAYKQATADAIILNKIGAAYHHLAAADVARQYYERALKLRPDYDKAINNLGTCAFEAGDYPAAVRYYRRALELRPDSTVTLVNLGTACFAVGKQQEGAAAYSAALAKDPKALNDDIAQRIDCPMTRQSRGRLEYGLARVYAQARLTRQAIEHLQKAVDLGFGDRKRIVKDAELENLHKTPELERLLDRMIHR